MKALLLEDDPVLSGEVSSFLQAKGMACDTVFDGDLFFRQQLRETYDIYLLDINVPRINGLDVCHRIREKDKNTPILMLTAYGEIDDKVEAFNRGADDYLVKPFHLEELYVRINSLCRRKTTPQAQQEIIRVADLEINASEKEVRRGTEQISLTPKEYNLLLILAKANGRVVPKNSIAEQLWDYHIETTQNTIEVYISFLRQKIDKQAERKLIHTKVGYGYYLKEEA
ncbi:MAG: response regulator transcription factor [Chitinophagaceae bacterium]|nr:response regulator transcription factor [Chitinophagaceae bacterium]